MDYDEHLLTLREKVKLSVGDDVMVLSEYSLIPGVVLKVNAKSIKVRVSAYGGCIAHDNSFKPEKVAKRGSLVALVWETWKGVNGRGGYRLETIMYQDVLKPVEQIRASRYLYETQFGEVTEHNKNSYLGR